jgi:uncharacterized protein (DUF1684 family)
MKEIVVRLSALLLVFGTALSAAALQAQSTSAAETAQWNKSLLDWRAQQAKDLVDPHGWLSLVGLEWLKPGVNSVGSATDNQIKLHLSGTSEQGSTASEKALPAHLGLFTVAGKIVQVLAPAAGFPQGLLIDGKPAREGILVVAGAKPSVLSWGTLSIVVIERDGRYALRIRDSAAPTLKNFRGLNWYAPNLHFRIPALWIPYTPPHIEKIATVIGTTLELPVPGAAEFSLNGEPMRIEPVVEEAEDGSGKKLMFILRDETSKTTTYQASRFLYTGMPDNGLSKDGVLMLDFNRLENPPCAYTAYATCPLPPDQNKLPVALEAGEMRYAP